MADRPVIYRWAILLAAGLAGCAAPAARRQQPPPPAPVAVQPLPAPGTVSAGVLARDETFVIYRAKPGDTYQSLARRFLDDPGRAWEIAEFAGNDPLTPGAEVVIPLAPSNPVGVYPDGYQTVPILCYHRFGDKQAKMVVAPEAFAAQMGYLADNGYRVISLSELAEFLAGRRALPRKTVVITMDDGYRSNYLHAYPELKRYGFPATIFLYTDFLGGGAALRPAEMREMVDSGLVDIQPHSKAHSNLALATSTEDDDAYTRRLSEELETSSNRISDLLGIPIHSFAYPYGDTNQRVIGMLDRAGYRLGATVQSGGNPAFAPKFLLRRTMVYGDDDLAAFEAKLAVFQRISKP